MKGIQRFAVHARAFSARLGHRGRFLIGIWLLFAILVGLRIHGSSIFFVAKFWAGDAAAQRHFLFAETLEKMEPAQANRYREALLAKPRMSRWDEWAHVIPAVLSQFTHQPRHPVVNTNFGAGQNMLVIPWVPVVHPTLVSRPVTWGYLMFGQRRGLAWSWWFSPFFCLSALYLLFEILFPGRKLIPTLGAVWITGSAYVVCWSHWPASYIGMGSMVICSAYWCLTVTSPLRRWLAGGGLGLTVAGFAILLYPPWLIPLGYTFATLGVGLVMRDRLWPRLRERQAIGPLVLGAALAAILVGTFLLSTADALAAMANTVYPGHRRLSGGDAPWAQIFGGFYNALTVRKSFDALQNESESAGFFLFMPVVILALLLSPGVRRRFDPVAWALLGLGIAFLIYGKFGFPQWLASMLLWDRFQGFRAQIAVGFISITLSLYLLSAGQRGHEGRPGHIIAAWCFVGSAAFFLWQGFELQLMAQLFPGAGALPLPVLLVSLLASGMGVLLVLGWSRVFAVWLVVALIATSGTFNPLYVAFPTLEGSEIRRAVRVILERDRKLGRNHTWLVYGGGPVMNTGALASMMGVKSISGIHMHPAPHLWKVLDPEGAHIEKTNRYAVVSLLQEPLDKPDVDLILPPPRNVLLSIHASPLHPAFAKLGARYAITFGRSNVINPNDFKLLYWSADRRSFAIWELTRPDPIADEPLVDSNAQPQR